MMIRERFAGDLKEAVKAKDSARVSTLRLICAAVKDRDIAARTDDNLEGVDDSEILAILAKMIRQREESARTYEQACRLDLAEQERDGGRDHPRLPAEADERDRGREGGRRGDR